MRAGAMSKMTAAAAATALTLSSALLLTSCSTIPATKTVSHHAAIVVARELAHDRPITFAVYGDSISAWDPPYAHDPAQSWTNTAASSDLHRVDGWALPGAKLDAMLAHAAPTTASFVVIMGGTNDMISGTPIAQRLAEIDSIAVTSQARTVVLSSVAPFNRDPALAVDWNAALQAHAAAFGWKFIDPWSVVRAGDRWQTGADHGDGVHPNPASAAQIGAEIRHDLLLLSGPPTRAR